VGAEPRPPDGRECHSLTVPSNISDRHCCAGMKNKIGGDFYFKMHEALLFTLNTLLKAACAPFEQACKKTSGKLSEVISILGPSSAFVFSSRQCNALCHHPEMNVKWKSSEVVGSYGHHHMSCYHHSGARSEGINLTGLFEARTQSRRNKGLLTKADVEFAMKALGDQGGAERAREGALLLRPLPNWPSPPCFEKVYAEKDGCLGRVR
jgi:hypothetical protein